MIGLSPEGVAVNPAGTRVYVTNPPGNNPNINVIDTSSNTVVAVISLTGFPHGLAVKPDGTRLYVANSPSDHVSVIDTSNNTTVATVPVQFGPYGVAVKPDGTRVYVTSNGYPRVSVIDTNTNTVVATIGMPIFAKGIAVTPDGSRAYVSSDTSSANYISVIDLSTNTVVAIVTVGSHPWNVAVNPQGMRAYVANAESNTVSVIDTSTNTVVATVPVDPNPGGVAVTPDGSLVYVANSPSNTVSVIDTSSNTVVATVLVGTCPNAFGNFIAAVPCPSPTPTPTPSPPPHPCQLRVLIVYADSLVPAEFEWEIQSQPNVAAVDLFDVRSATPTLAQLQQYDIVVPFSDYDFQDTDTLGNNLADYVDGGGIVVQFGMSHRGPSHNNEGLFGRWVTGDYNAYYYSNPPFFYRPFTLGTFNAAHPLMAGVTTLSSDAWINAPLLGSTEVARDNSGNSLVAFRQVSGGRTTVGVTAYVGDIAFASGDWGKVVVNAGNWLLNCQVGGTPTPTPTASPTCTVTPWQSVASMPLDRYGAAAASDGTYFYAAGGYSWDGGTQNALYRWSPDPPPSGTWTILASMPQVANVATGVYYPPTNKIYVFGGYNDESGQNLNSTQIYDIASNTWSIGSHMPDMRSQCAGGYVPATGKIYIISGYNTGSVTSAQPNTWEYDPVSDSWTDLTGSAPFPHPAGGFAYGVINNKLYVAGGRDANNQIINLTWEYDPVADTYTQKADEPSSFQNNVPGSVVASGLLWVFGGGNPFAGAGIGDSALPPTEALSDGTKAGFRWTGTRDVGEAFPTTASDGRYYNPVSDTWNSSPSLVVARSFPSSGAIGDNLLIAAGGYNGVRSVATVQSETVCIGAPLPTPTVTPTPTPAVTATATPTATATATATPTPRLTATATATHAPTCTPTSTPTATATPRPSPTPRFSPAPRSRPTPAPRP
jgi:YVTN family beta-propeller protein